MPNQSGDQAATASRPAAKESTLSDSERASNVPDKGEPEPETENNTATTGRENPDGEVDASNNNDSAPPLPPGSPPEDGTENDGWQPVWDEAYGAYYFYNSITGETTWTNPRVPEIADEPTIPLNRNHVDAGAQSVMEESTSATEDAPSHDPLQYNPAIHGDYDPTAPYAQRTDLESEASQYTSVAAFNRFTGKFQPAKSHLVPENHNDENKSKRQMEFYFDVDAAANSHDGRSLKAERQTKRLSKQELKQYKEKRKQRKEEKRKAWLRD